eukprot:Gb_35365 [translate_table: standard]
MNSPVLAKPAGLSDMATGISSTLWRRNSITHNTNPWKLRSESSLPISWRTTLSLQKQRPNIITSCRQGMKFSASALLRSSSDPAKELCNENVVATENEIEVEKPGFDWYSHWYAVAPVDDLDKRIPYAFTILGISLVVWWDKTSQSWQVFEDKCPHRLAPLSEGRIDEDGHLQCCYHGWCFEPSGACTYIPQAPSDGPPVMFICLIFSYY